MGKTTDIEIVMGILKGDEGTLKYFYDKNFFHVKEYIINNSGNVQDAEDIFQESLLIVYQQLKSSLLELNYSIHSYFYGVCRNVWRNQMRKNHKIIFSDSISEYVDERKIQEEETASISQYKEQIYRKHFAELDCKSKDLLKLFFAGKTTKEISDELNCTEGAIRKRKFECKKFLLSKIEKDPMYQELLTTPGAVAQKFNLVI